MGTTVQPAHDRRVATDRPPRIVLAHDWLCGLRGGEHVLDAIIAALDGLGYAIADLLVMFDDGRPLTPRIDRLSRFVSPLGRLGGFSDKARRHLLPLYPWAVSRLSAQLHAIHAACPIDAVISTSSAAIKGLLPPPGVPHLCYVHTPARYLWSQREQYARGSLLRGMGLALAGPALRSWDLNSSTRATQLLANSEHTRDLIRRVWNRESTVLYPGVRTEYFGQARSASRSGDWLVVSALEPYKRVDLAVAAAHQTGNRLLVIGDGSQRRELESRAPGNVTFLGRIDDEQLRQHYAAASLLIHPQIEDFGIVAVEAQAAGLPVVALARGGATETVVDGATGAMFVDQNVGSLLEAIKRVPQDCDQTCRTNAARFSEANFARGFLAALMPLIA